MHGRQIVVAAAATDDGMGCVRHFCNLGAHVIALDADADALEGLAAGIDEQRGSITVHAVDLASEAEMARVAEALATQIDCLHGLVTCAKDWEIAPIAEAPIATWERVLRSNVIGPVVAAKYLLPLLERSGSGAIVHIGSVDGILGNSAVPSYSASKGALVALTHVMADEFAAHGVRVNCIARAMAVERGMATPDVFKPLLDHTPLGRPGYHDEIAAAVSFLLSPEASYITGAVLPVDGGRSVITQGTRILR